MASARPRSDPSITGMARPLIWGRQVTGVRWHMSGHGLTRTTAAAVKARRDLNEDGPATSCRKRVEPEATVTEVLSVGGLAASWPSDELSAIADGGDHIEDRLGGLGRVLLVMEQCYVNRPLDHPVGAVR